MGVQFKITLSVLGLFSLSAAPWKCVASVPTWSLSGARSHLQLNKSMQVSPGELCSSSAAQLSPSETLKVTQGQQHYRRQADAGDKTKSGKRLNTN